MENATLIKKIQEESMENRQLDIIECSKINRVSNRKCGIDIAALKKMLEEGEN